MIHIIIDAATTVRELRQIAILASGLAAGPETGAPNVREKACPVVRKADSSPVAAEAQDTTGPVAVGLPAPAEAAPVTVQAQPTAAPVTVQPQPTAAPVTVQAQAEAEPAPKRRPGRPRKEPTGEPEEKPEPKPAPLHPAQIAYNDQLAQFTELLPKAKPDLPANAVAGAIETWRLHGPAYLEQLTGAVHALKIELGMVDAPKAEQWMNCPGSVVLATIRAALKGYTERHDLDAGMALLEKFGCSRASDVEKLDAEQQAEFLVACDA